MSVRVRWIFRLSVVALLTSAACREPSSGPEDDAPPTGPRYGLVLIDAEMLPRLVSSVGEDSMFLDAEVVMLRSDGVAEFVRTYRRVLGSTSTEIGSTSFSMPFVRAGTSITVGVAVNCVTLPCPTLDGTGSITEELLLLNYAFAPASTYRYARIAP